MTQTILDGGGKVMGATVLKSNTTYQNWVIQGGTQFTSNGLAITNVKILSCIFENIVGTPIFIGNYQGSGGASSNIEVAHCTMDDFSTQQYYWEFQNCSNLLVHDNSFTNGAPTTYDGGVIYAQFSSGSFYNMFCDTFHGKFIRLWPAANSTSYLYNLIPINSDKYSAIEIQEFAAGSAGGSNPNATVYVDNCTGGNFPEEDNTATGFITLYNLVTTKYYFGSSKPNIVFNTSTGLLDNGGNKNGPFAPQNANWQTVNKYYTTQALAAAASGWASGDGNILLPDGTTWNGSKTTTTTSTLPATTTTTSTLPPTTTTTSTTKATTTTTSSTTTTTTSKHIIGVEIEYSDGSIVNL